MTKAMTKDKTTVPFGTVLGYLIVFVAKGRAIKFTSAERAFDAIKQEGADKCKVRVIYAR